MARFGPQSVQVLSVLLDRGPSFLSQTNAGPRRLADDVFVNLDETGAFELREMCRQVALAQTCQALEGEEIRALADRQRRQQREPRRFMDDLVDPSKRSTAVGMSRDLVPYSSHEWLFA